MKEKDADLPQTLPTCTENTSWHLDKPEAHSERWDDLDQRSGIHGRHHCFPRVCIYHINQVAILIPHTGTGSFSKNRRKSCRIIHFSGETLITVITINKHVHQNDSMTLTWHWEKNQEATV